MRNRSPLALIEQLAMLLVFALAAALCVQALAAADRISARTAEADRALLAAQNAAEALKADPAPLAQAGDEGLWYYYDAAWQPCAEAGAAYRVQIRPQESGHPLLWAADVTVQGADGQVLAALPAAGQKGG